MERLEWHVIVGLRYSLTVRQQPCKLSVLGSIPGFDEKRKVLSGHDGINRLTLPLREGRRSGGRKLNGVGRKSFVRE